MDALGIDLRSSARRLRTTAGFSLLVVTILALGIGASTAMYSLVRSVLLDPLGFDEPDRLVFVQETNRRGPDSVAYLNFRDWQAGQESFESLSAFVDHDMTWTGGPEPARLRGVWVTGELFDTLRVRPLLGRTLEVADDRYEAAPVVVVSAGFWRQWFGADPGVLGSTLELDRRTYTVVGVMADDFRFPFFDPGRRTDLWVPMDLFSDRGNMQQRSDHPGIHAVGRLRDGVSIDAARQDLRAIAAALEQQFPDSNAGASVEMRPLHEIVVATARPALLVLVAAVGLMILIVCANAAGLLLVLATGRRQELALRAALGASRGRLLRSVLTDGLLLAAAGAVGGVILAAAVVRFLSDSGAGGLPRVQDAHLDPGVVSFALAMSLATWLVSSAVPALQVIRGVRHGSLTDRGSTAGARRVSLRSSLVVAEVVLATVLLVGAGLAGQSLGRLLGDDPGIDPDGVLTAQLRARDGRYAEPDALLALFLELRERLPAIPGVVAAGTISPLPLSGDGWGRWYHVEGAPPPDPADIPTADYALVSVGGLEAIGARLLRGRFFSASDSMGAAPVAVVDHDLAERWWPGEEVIGKRLRMGATGSPGDPWIDIVGVVASVKNHGVAGRDREQIYRPAGQEPFGSLSLVVRTTGDPYTLASAVRSLVRDIDPQLPLYDVRSLADHRDDRAGAQPLVSALLAGFAVAGQLLAALGLYGITAYSVAARRREIGIRMAIGARPVDALMLILRQGGNLVVAGVVTGIAASLVLSRVLASELYGIDGVEPGVLCGAAAVVVASSLLAAAAPSARAARLDPAITLKAE